MRREGSPWRGLGVVFLKELSDHLTNMWMVGLQLFVVIAAGAAVVTSTQQIHEAASEIQQLRETLLDPHLYLLLFTEAGAPLSQYPLVLLLAWLVPVVAIGLGFNLINGEHNGRTLSRILAQPIYRDALLLGKFLAGLATISIILVALWLLVIGFGMLTLGIGPSAAEMARLLAVLAVTIVYAGVWLALAMLFSVVFRSMAASVLVPLLLLLFLILLWPPLVSFLANAVSSPEDPLGLLDAQLAFRRMSPMSLYGEAVSVVLHPAVRSIQRSAQEALLAQYGIRLVEPGAMRSDLALSQSLLIVWAQIVSLVGAMILLFVGGYVAFQRQEVRA